MHRQARVIVCALSLLLLVLALSQSVDAAECNRRMGPFMSEYEAGRVAQSYRSRGYGVSGVWGEGGVVSNWSNRRYFFNVFWPC
jgi:hypothetical protein